MTIERVKETTTERETVITHPAFGMIKVHRVQGGIELFGSEMHHDRYIMVEIATAEQHRSLSANWYYDKKDVVEIAMSEAQWATFLSAMNLGSGVPCTLIHLDRRQFPRIERTVSDKSRFKAEMAEKLDRAVKDLESAAAVLGEKPLKAGRIAIVVGLLKSAAMNIGSNARFVANQFDEHMEEKTEAAKAEIHAMAMQVLSGVPLVQQDEPKLIEGKVS